MAEDLRHIVGQRVRELRKQAGLTQEELADKADSDFRHIGRIERGESHIQLNTLAWIAQALGVSPAELLEPSPKLPSKRKIPSPKDEILEELTNLLKGKSEDDVRLALEVVKTLLRHKRGKGTGQKKRKRGSAPQP
jgi:transcriptional regulator with XRE-family HTH domain